MSNRAALALVFVTSAAILVLEILAGRLLAPFIGVSLETFTAIIGTVLAGIALGNAVGGRAADVMAPGRLLGPLVVAAGALTLLAPPLVSALGPSSNGRSPISVVVLVAMTFFAPAALLSTVSPLVAKLRLDDLEETGAVVGSLSASGTAGALVGTFITGFVAVAALPTRPMVLAVGVALVALGAVLWFRYRSAGADLGMASVSALLVGGLNLVVNNPCDVETAYACAEVVADAERPDGRSLYLDGLRHSYVDLSDPTYLEFRYMRLFADAIDAMDPAPPEPLNALHIGGAGFTMPRWLEASRPGSDSLVLEIDDRLVQLAEDELGLVFTDRLRVEVGDARLTIDEANDGAYDLVITDVFSGQTMPWHLTTVEYFAEIDATMAPGALLMTNLIDGGETNFGRASISTHKQHFEHVVAIVPPDAIGADGSLADLTIDRPKNVIIVASHDPLPTFDIDPEDGILLSEADTTTWADGADHLRDDYAPVDQLRQS